MQRIWRSEHADWATKKRVFVTYIQSTVLHGCETWTMNSETEKAINSFNSKCMATLTGRTIYEEAKDPSHNLLIAVFERRRGWAKKLLGLRDERLAKQALKATFEHDKKEVDTLLGGILGGRDMTWTELEDMAGDRGEWRKESMKINTELIQTNKKGILRRNATRKCRE